MSGPTQPCGVCGQDTSNVEGGLPLCHEHAAVARRLAQLGTAKTDFDLIGSRSHGERNENGGMDGRRTTYDIVPERDVERVSRDVEVNAHGVPLWAVESLFNRLHAELGRPDIADLSASLYVSYEMLDEEGFTRLEGLPNTFDLDLTYEITKTRIYPPKRLMSQKIAEVDAEQAQARAQGGQGE